MPDSFGFDHLTHWGSISHVCIECGWPGWGVIVSEADRGRHHLSHRKQTAKELEKQRLANLALARKAKRQIERENELAYSEGEE